MPSDESSVDDERLLRRLMLLIAAQLPSNSAKAHRVLDGAAALIDNVDGRPMPKGAGKAKKGGGLHIVYPASSPSNANKRPDSSDRSPK